MPHFWGTTFFSDDEDEEIRPSVNQGKKRGVTKSAKPKKRRNR